MRTATATTTKAQAARKSTTTTAKPDPASRSNIEDKHPGLARLAWQLEMDVTALVDAFIHKGIRDADYDLAKGAEPLELSNDFDCTDEMNRLTFDEIAEIVETSGKDCQEVLLERHETARYARDLSKIVPFHP